MTSQELHKQRIGGLVSFNHHTEALEWVEKHAQGPVVVHDDWTYGFLCVGMPDMRAGEWMTVNHWR